jgi:hypothetical protein
MKNYFKILWEKIVKCFVTNRIKRRSSNSKLKFKKQSSNTTEQFLKNGTGIGIF